MTKDEMRALLAKIPRKVRKAKTTYYVPGKAYVYAAAPWRGSAKGQGPAWADVVSGLRTRP